MRKKLISKIRLYSIPQYDFQVNVHAGSTYFRGYKMFFPILKFDIFAIPSSCFIFVSIYASPASN